MLNHEEEWTRIPVPVEDDADRRQLCGILTACGLCARVVRVRDKPKAPIKRYIEYARNAME